MERSNWPRWQASGGKGYRGRRIIVFAGLLFFLVASEHSLAHAQGVHVALTPTDSIVDPGSEFVVRIEVTDQGSDFNGYESVITFDPAVLSFVPVSPTSAQEGSYMTGVCGNTYHRFYEPAGSDSMKVTHVLLCGGPVLTGPGVLYKLRFAASDQPTITTVEFRSIEFADAGYSVEPVLATNATIRIGSTTDASGIDARVTGIRLSISPNPFNPSTVVQITNGAMGFQRLLVHDVTGKRVRLLQDGYFESGSRLVTWDGRDDRGAYLSSGIYLITLSGSGRRTSERVVLLK